MTRGDEASSLPSEIFVSTEKKLTVADVRQRFVEETTMETKDSFTRVLLVSVRTYNSGSWPSEKERPCLFWLLPPPDLFCNLPLTRAITDISVMEMTTTKMLQANFRRGVFHRVRWNTILVEDAQRILEQRHGRVSTEIRLYTCTYENEETAVALMQLLSMHATKVVINAAKGWKDSFESLNPGHLQVLDLYGVSELALFKSFESMQSLVKIPTQQLCLTFWSYVEPDLSAQLFAALKSGMQNPGENAKDVCLFHFYHSQKVEMVQQVCDADVFTQVSLDKTSLDACLSSLPLLVRHCRRLRKISCYPDGAIKNSERAQLKSSIGNDLESNGTLEHFEFGHNDWEDAKVQSYLRRNVALQKATEFVAEEHTQTEWIDFLSSFTLQENDGEALSAIYLVLRCTLADVLA